MEGLTGGTMPGAVSFPDGLRRTTSFDPQLEQEIGDIISRQEAASAVPNMWICRIHRGIPSDVA